MNGNESHVINVLSYKLNSQLNSGGLVRTKVTKLN